MATTVRFLLYAGLSLALEGAAWIMIFQSEMELFLWSLTPSKVSHISASSNIFLTILRASLKFCLSSDFWRVQRNCLIRRRSLGLTRSLISWLAKGQDLLLILIDLMAACEFKTECRMSFEVLSLNSTSLSWKILGRVVQSPIKLTQG